MWLTSMYSRLDNIPVYETRALHIRAADYNLVKIALKRLTNPIRFAIPQLRTLDFLLEDELWVIVDRSLNDIPVIAWLQFEDQQRSTLHEPIICQQRIYHAHAMIIVDKAFEALHLILGEKLTALDDLPESNKVTQLRA